jgi:ribonucleoside-diphosphate reductase alpha chain
MRYEDYTLDKFYGENILGKNVFTSKYAAPEDYTNNQPNLLKFWERLAGALASAEKDRDHWYPKFLGQLKDFKLLFGGRINYALGRVGVKATLKNCYTIPIKDDSLYGIYTALAQTGRTYAATGGVGNHISILRPKDAPVRGAAMGAPGAVSFMDLFSANTGTIAQDGRRGAEMISIDVWHPDVHDFVDIKNDGWTELLEKIGKHTPSLAKQFNDKFGDRRKVSFANISPHISDEFMYAVENDLDFNYRFPDIANCPKEDDHTKLSAYKDKYRNYLILFDGYEPFSNDLDKKLSELVKQATIYDTRWNGYLDEWEANNYPVKIYKTEKARVLWNKLVLSAHKSAEPGLLFKGNFDKAWTAKDRMLTSNPCGGCNAA